MPTPSSAMDSDAAERDYQRARDRLAMQDLDGAAQWLERAATNGHAAALTELAILHLHGFGREANPAHAVELLLRAELAGGTPETPYLLAQIAMGGVVLPHDPRRIDAWLSDSARRGYPAALRAAALRFGQREDAIHQRAAVTCLQRATDARDPVSAALLADRLHAGRGVARDPAQATELANELRAMGIPVELPKPAGDAADAVVAESAGEPPWESLLLFESPKLPNIQRQCTAPEITTYDELLSDEECRYLIYSGARFLERSQVVHPITGQPIEYEVRTSQDMVFVPTNDDIGIRILQRRMTMMAGLEWANSEPLTLLRYGIGDQYRPHRDYFFPSAPQLAQPGGQRHSTVCVYLNNVQEGGETVFPDKAVTVQPQRGRAVMFRNLGADGSPNASSLHAGKPVLAGEKWLASCWIRVNPLRQF
jgi:prolyl 4-hydroxylase